MPHIIILSASIRNGRKSHRVALYFKKYLEENKLATATIADLNEYRFPLFNERLKFQPNPTADVIAFANDIRSADGVIIVTPEYNGGYPASLKNVIDLLYEEWQRKPVAISTVSDGVFGGTQVITSLQFTLWKIRAWTVRLNSPFRKWTNFLIRTAMRPIPKKQIYGPVHLFMNYFGVWKPKKE